MISFPIFRRLRVEGYGLFPGSDGRGIDVEFAPGLTLVLGANGLGKTTLVLMLYRMCTGRFDIPGLTGSSELGTRSTDASELRRPDQRLFAARVTDGATDATAELTMMLGDTEVVVKRALDSLSLRNLRVDRTEILPSEDLYQEMICESTGVNSFGDWILLLRHLTFYFEDRRALVWDPSARRQILRILFLSRRLSTEWTQSERAVLELDSGMRNLQNVLTREERSFREIEAAVGDESAMREELTVLDELQRIDQPKLESLNEEIGGLEAERQDARLRALQAELDHESAFRDVERRQLLAIGAAFPDADETARYVLGKLLAEAECLACGTMVPDVASHLKDRLESSRCVVCGSANREAAAAPSVVGRGIERATDRLERAEDQLRVAIEQRDETEQSYRAALYEIQRLTADIADREARVEALLMRLPPDEAQVHTRRTQIVNMRVRVEVMREELAEMRSALAQFVDGINRALVRRKGAIQRTFHDFAKGFLLEETSLLWSPRPASVGQFGQQINFPAFELEMTGGTFTSQVRRTGPEQVSESQREFIDLAFRMTLMQVAGVERAGSLVIDAPESSLDAVFVSRAADVLARFGSPDGANRLVITSNLIEGDLIPELLRASGIRTARDRRIVDLLSLAVPTRATQEWRADYEKVRAELFRRARRQRK
jgi:hypothetical protein